MCFKNKRKREAGSQTIHNLGLWKEKTGGERLYKQNIKKSKKKKKSPGLEMFSTVPVKSDFKNCLPFASLSWYPNQYVPAPPFSPPVYPLLFLVIVDFSFTVDDTSEGKQKPTRASGFK